MYTGAHRQGERCFKHPKTSKYYVISHPLAKNSHSKKACVSAKWLGKQDKDFIFQYLDEGEELRTIRIHRDHVKANAKPFWTTVKGDHGENKRVCNHSFYMIEIAKLFEYGEEIVL